LERGKDFGFVDLIATVRSVLQTQSALKTVLNSLHRLQTVSL